MLSRNMKGIEWNMKDRMRCNAPQYAMRRNTQCAALTLAFIKRKIIVIK